METTNSLPLAILGMPPDSTMGMAIALVVLGLLVWGVKNPLAWVVVAILFITAGAGCLVYGIADLIALDAHYSPSEHIPRIEVQKLPVFIGGGAGGALGGAVLLWVTFLRRKNEGQE